MNVMVGIPSYNNADTIEYVVQQAAEGLVKYFGEGIVANSDGGSTDGTRDVVMNTKVPEGVEVRSFVYKWPIPGKGSAVKELIEMAKDEGVDTLVLVDSDLRSITPEWILKLAKPLEEGYDFVAPYYIRHKYDGTITNNIAYPMTTALYGKDIRQPIGGDFGISSRLFDTYLGDEAAWKSDVAKFGVDAFLTTTAIGEGFKVCQAALGVKIHNPKDPAASLGPMFSQVLGTIFMLMEKYDGIWAKISTIDQAPIVGNMESGVPEPINVSIDKLKLGIRGLYSDNEWLLKKALAPETFAMVKRAIRTYRIDDLLWSHVLYDSSVAYKEGVLSDIKALIPLYFAKTLDFIEQTKDIDTNEAEKIVKDRVNVFVEEKGYLIERWHSHEKKIKT